jgi:hypothetical protein
MGKPLPRLPARHIGHLGSLAALGLTSPFRLQLLQIPAR